jgi:hypothetical protein
MTALPPPPVLAGARVLEYACVDETVHFTGRLHLYRDDVRVGEVPRLAICREFDDGLFLLVHCDEQWEVLGVQAWNASGVEAPGSLEQARLEAEHYYAGISRNWVALDVPLEEALRYSQELDREFICSFCGKGPEQRSSVFRSGKATICGDCVRELHQMLSAESPGEEGTSGQ